MQKLGALGQRTSAHYSTMGSQKSRTTCPEYRAYSTRLTNSQNGAGNQACTAVQVIWQAEVAEGRLYCHRLSGHVLQTEGCRHQSGLRWLERTQLCSLSLGEADHEYAVTQVQETGPGYKKACASTAAGITGWDRAFARASAGCNGAASISLPLKLYHARKGQTLVIRCPARLSCKLAVQVLVHPDLVLVVAGSELALLFHGQAHILCPRKPVPVCQRGVFSLLHILNT